MRFRTLAVGIAAVGLLAVGAVPAPAQDIKEFEGTIALPAPIVSNEMVGHWVTSGELRQVCPGEGDTNGIFYLFFDLEADYKYFFVSGPELTVNEPEPSGLWGSIQDYDLDLYLFDEKCNELEVEGSIMTGAGVGNGMAAGKKLARYAAISYFAGPPNLPVLLEASNEKITK